MSRPRLWYGFVLALWKLLDIPCPEKWLVYTLLTPGPFFFDIMTVNMKSSAATLNNLWWITSNNPTFNPKNWATCQVHLQSNFFNFHWWSCSNRIIYPRSISAEMWFGFVISWGISLSTCCVQDIPSFSNASAEHKAVTICPRWMLLLPWHLSCMLDWSSSASASRQSHLE